jgi:ATP-dependent RNA helicase SUPV3L1/SUV3
LSHRPAWLESGAYWQERARAIEDKLSDALHEKLTQRFVDRRTSTLVRRLKDEGPLLAGVNDDGEVIVEGQFVGRLLGFEFIVDPRANGAAAKSLRAAGEKAVKPLLAARAAALANAPASELALREDGAIWWRSARVAQLQKGASPLRPGLVVAGIADITANMRGRVEDRLKEFLIAKIESLLGPLIQLQKAANAEGEDALEGLTRGVAYRLVENFGATSRAQFGDDLKQISQTERAKLRKLGMRFGEYTLFVPALLKPAPAKLLTLLWALWNDRDPLRAPPPKPGLVSLEMEESLPHAYYYAAGYRPSGGRAVRIDMLERLAGLIRTARNEADMREGFEATPQMMSLVGCSGEEFEAIMRSLGLRKNVVTRKPRATPPAAPVPDAAKGAPPDAAPQSADRQDAPFAPLSDASEKADSPSSQAAGPDPATSQPAPSEAENRHAPGTGPEETAPDATVPSGAPDGAASDVEVALWRPAPRKVFAKPKRDPKDKDAPKDRRAKSAPKAKGNKNANRPPRSGLPRDNMPMHEPRHRKTADPDSPFAVLASLKSQLSGAKADETSKEPEKTE